MKSEEAKYKEAYRKFKGWLSNQAKSVRESAISAKIFPELPKSSSEEIRKEILEYFSQFEGGELRGVDITPWITWLKKQEFNRPQPKFRVGDRIVEKAFDECGSGTIKEIRDGKYIFEDGSYIDIEEQDLWQLVERSKRNEDDDWMLNVCKNAIVLYGRGNNIDSRLVINWLVSKIQTAQREWTEKDDAILNSIVHSGQNHCYLSHSEIEWLISLKSIKKGWKKSLNTADLENSLCDLQDNFSDTSYEYKVLGEAIEFIRSTDEKNS